jgi:hypothetical protein
MNAGGIMDTNSISKIEIVKKIKLFGKGDTLESRLRNVSLRGFEDVKIYQLADIHSVDLTPQGVQETLYTPQPHLHREYLTRVMELAKLFESKDIDIFHLDYAYDYIAYSPLGEPTEWTMLPPIVEKVSIPQHALGGFDYEATLAPELKQSLKTNGWQVNPATTTMPYPSKTGEFRLINDGSHRIHAGIEAGIGITIIEISSTTEGYPYYAAPQHYSTVQVFDRENSTDLKVHVIDTPGQKQLYRLFPSGGIMSGSVRPERKDETFI